MGVQCVDNRVGVQCVDRQKKGYSGYNRQYLLDQTAANVGHARIVKSESPEGEYEMVQVASNFQWRFQKFKITDTTPGGGNRVVISPKIGNTSNKNSIRYGISRQDPKGIDRQPQKTVWQVNTKSTQFSGDNHIVYSDLRELLTSLVSAGFTMATDALTAEVLLGDND